MASDLHACCNDVMGFSETRRWLDVASPCVCSCVCVFFSSAHVRQCLIIIKASFRGGEHSYSVLLN